MASIEKRRAFEFGKYDICYQTPSYKMGEKRQTVLRQKLEKYSASSVLDVGCGRGELLDIAEELEYDHVKGYETCKQLCTKEGVFFLANGAHDMPEEDSSWDVVVCSDVLEHCLEEDIHFIISELFRVARLRVLLTIAYFPSGDLHITVKPREWWLERLEEVADHVIECDEVWHAKTGTFEMLKGV